ncbi:MAG: DUF1552 domain-containing protein [Polyangiaceae bacterium]|nr:DUF1552 domain-containing protein [Polyangiaceae bacterium]
MKDLLRASRAKARFNRRLFLQALGVGLSAPVAARLVRSASAAPTGAPQRFMLFYMPHGVATEHFAPKVNDDGSFTLADSGVSILGPLEPYKNLVNIYQGFNYPGANTHEGIVKFLSNYTGNDTDDQGSRTSIEHYLGNELGTGTLALGAIPHRPWGIDFDGKLMWDGQFVVPQNNPLKAYDEVFGSWDAAPAEDSTQDVLFQSLLNLNEGDISRLQGELQGLTRAQTKLQTHLEAVQALRSSSSSANLSCTMAPTIEAVEALRSVAGSSEMWFLEENNFEVIFRAHLELAAHAMICNARPVTALQSLYANCEIDFGFAANHLGLASDSNVNLARGHHNGLSHTTFQISSGNIDLQVRADFAWAQRYFVQMLVDHVITKLDVEDPAAPGSTVLENTTILLCSEVGDGANHTSATNELLNGPPPGLTSHLALATIGGAAGALRTGQVLNYNDGSGTDRPAGDLWLTIAQAMGISATEFSGATNPVSEALA